MNVVPEIKKNIGEALSNFSYLTQTLLALRGITDPEEAQAFLSPDYDAHTHDPHLLKDIEKAAERIIEAVKAGEKICIYSDYDMDGIPGAVIFADFFKEVGYGNVIHYIPHRNTEGFGLNTDAIQALAQKNISLLITIDCGIANEKEVEKASELGMDVIITDHHLPNRKKPEAYAVVNPKQEGSKYPFKDLCGAAVAFKLIQVLMEKSEHEFQEGWEKWLLDMAGMATIADMVPLVGENRALAYYGLKVLRKSRRPGLLALLEKTRVNQRYLTEEDVGFSIGPRVNAASRMDHPMDAFELLSTDDEVRARELAEYLEHINNERKGVVAAMVKEARKKLDEREEGSVIVVGNPEWKPGLLGLVCNALIRVYNKPVFVWGREGADVIKGSCRSEGVHVLNVMEQVNDGVFIEYGGHAFSGGFSLEVENVHNLSDELEEAFRKSFEENSNAGKPTADITLSPEEITWTLFDEIKQFAPFGEGNPQPLFAVKDALIEEVSLFGKRNNHTKLKISNGIEAISFFTQPEEYGVLPEAGKEATIIGHIEKNTFGWGKPSLRIRIVDIVR